jgi:hypothetical protein
MLLSCTFCTNFWIGLAGLGILKKQGALIKSWKARFVVLHRDQLVYWDTRREAQQGKAYKGEIPVGVDTLVTPPQVWACPSIQPCHACASVSCLACSFACPPFSHPTAVQDSDSKTFVLTSSGGLTHRKYDFIANTHQVHSLFRVGFSWLVVGLLG